MTGLLNAEKHESVYAASVITQLTDLILYDAGFLEFSASNLNCDTCGKKNTCFWLDATPEYWVWRALKAGHISKGLVQPRIDPMTCTGRVSLFE